MFVTQYDAHAVEANGLLKMDFFGSAKFNLCSENEGSSL